MVNTLRVMLWDEEIGRLAWDNRRRLSYFTYNPEFLKKGIDISPLQAPVRGIRAMTPVWGEDARMYQKLPAFLADSLPDAWGNQLFELWRIQNHSPNADITPLDKLSFIGKRGMGALEFLPEVAKADKAEMIDVKSLADLAERIFIERENAHIMPEESITMQSLLTVGTSAGGRQPKAIIAINKATGEIRSGQVAGLQDYDYYILKFGDTKYSSAEIEMTYYEMAVKAGIDMMPSRLYEIEGNRNFITKRFDRDGERKLHTQTLAAISPDMQFLMPGSQAIQHATASTTQRGRRHDNTLPRTAFTNLKCHLIHTHANDTNDETHAYGNGHDAPLGSMPDSAPFQRLRPVVLLRRQTHNARRPMRLQGRRHLLPHWHVYRRKGL